MRQIIKSTMLALIALIPIQLKAQDIIRLKSGDTIQAKVLTVSETEVEYKRFSNSEGPLYRVSISSIESIQYQSGETDVFSKDSSSVPAPSSSPVSVQSDNTLKSMTTYEAGSASEDTKDYFTGALPWFLYNGTLLFKTPPTGYKSSFGMVHNVELGVNFHFTPRFFMGAGFGYEFFDNNYGHEESKYNIEIKRHSLFLSERIGYNFLFGDHDRLLRIYAGPQQALVVGGSVQVGSGKDGKSPYSGPKTIHYLHAGFVFSFGGGGFGAQFRLPMSDQIDASYYYNNLVTTLTIFMGF